MRSRRKNENSGWICIGIGGQISSVVFYLYRVCPAKLNHTCRCKSGLARDPGDCLQSRNVPFGTYGDLISRYFPGEMPYFRLNMRLK
ncbi:hypothetical protein DW887_13460 [Lachnospiraceae bacterium AM40-2BH]|nr:hypothetical protein DW887_13460 [Lachnospiraceae bacterium AM40-2BH]